MCGHHHPKRYDVQDTICANVIRALRCSYLSLDSGFEDTVFARSDAAATIYFIVRVCAAFIRERRLFESGIY